MARPRHLLFLISTVLALVSAGCFAHAGTDIALGEQHDVGYEAPDAFVYTQDVLRGEGILFTVQPDNMHLVTSWKDADTPAGVWADLVGIRAQYRYEIEVVPTGPRQSRVIANLRAEDIDDDQLDTYKATKRLDLFNRLDKLLAQAAPVPATPRTGGVNFALLPGEDLPALAKRATGRAENWRAIATDNGLGNGTNLTGVQSVWIRNSLLHEKKAEPR